MTTDTHADGEALAEAIAELRRVTPAGIPWGSKDLFAGPPDRPVPWCPAEIATILNAVLSGALIPRPAEPTQAARRLFPILKGGGAKIDYQLVADHAEQAKKNHYQSVERLAERGGLSWCELYAVLHNRRWEKIDDNEAIIACRALEARYLAAIKETSDAG